ncbi:hypothetical protein [Nonomuraea sp. NPDC052265]|uniref:hypothetical protein n=1 Tax=Nonomuraea sp. NPDC052265 TaxID=3364374 RepID=UPI0037C88900
MEPFSTSPESGTDCFVPPASGWHKKDATPSPYRYDLVDYRTGGIPDDLSYAGPRPSSR